jgi:hypothetical protein
MRDLAINPRKGRKKGKAVRITYDEHEKTRKKVFVGCKDQPDLGRMANLRLVDKQGKGLVELKLQVLA